MGVRERRKADGGGRQRENERGGGEIGTEILFFVPLAPPSQATEAGTRGRQWRLPDRRVHPPGRPVVQAVRHRELLGRWGLYDHHDAGRSLWAPPIRGGTARKPECLWAASRIYR